MRDLLMIRHGITKYNEEKLITGAADIPLSAAGRAALLPLAGTYPAASMFFTSGMLRAKETLAILYGDVQHIDVTELAETNFGIFEGRHHDELCQNEPLYVKWRAGNDIDVQCPNGESRREFSGRVRIGLQKVLTHTWKDLAVLVTHGGVIHVLMKQIDTETHDHASPAGNACGYILHILDDHTICGFEDFP